MVPGLAAGEAVGVIDVAAPKAVAAKPTASAMTPAASSATSPATTALTPTTTASAAPSAAGATTPATPSRKGLGRSQERKSGNQDGDLKRESATCRRI